jgi:hypothetical protein
VDENRYKVIQFGLPIVVVIVAVCDILVKPPLWKAPPLHQTILFWSVLFVASLAIPRCVEWFFGDGE